MGYRSDVAYGIKFDDIEQRDAFVVLMRAKNDALITQALDEINHDDNKDPIITFSCESTKWYDSFPDVRVHHALMEQAHELYGAGYRFVRIGEDANDIDVQDVDDKGLDLWEYVEPITTISTNF